MHDLTARFGLWALRKDSYKFEYGVASMRSHQDLEGWNKSLWLGSLYKKRVE